MNEGGKSESEIENDTMKIIDLFMNENGKSEKRIENLN